MTAKRFVDWSFDHYLKIAHPDFALGGRGTVQRTRDAAQPVGAARRSG